MLYNQSRVFFRVPISFHREKIQKTQYGWSINVDMYACIQMIGIIKCMS